jgi:queuine tRNA-ribosyltransferase
MRGSKSRKGGDVSVLSGAARLEYWETVSDIRYQLVHLQNGATSIRSLEAAETFHPVVGPVAEAQALYVNQLRLRERLGHHQGQFVIWDVGLGAAANALTVVNATRDLACQLRIASFDCTPEPLEFALMHAGALGYFAGHEQRLHELLRAGSVKFQDGPQSVEWEFHLGDFPSLLANAVQHLAESEFGAPPHAILFDAYSPARNPAMWTLPLFSNLFQLLDPQRPCALPTYSRSTIMRVTLLLAGFHVGVGHATGEKTETTIAANTLELIEEPLDRRWLDRARRSHRAEPLMEPVHHVAPLSDESWERLQAHPQFSR